MMSTRTKMTCVCVVLVDTTKTNDQYTLEAATTRRNTTHASERDGVNPWTRTIVYL